MLLKAHCPPLPAGLTKTLRIMKLTAFLLLSACLAASANSKAQTITLSVKDVPLEKVFTEIKKQSAYSFVYYKADLANRKKVTLQLQNAGIEEALQSLFKDQPLTYSIIEKNIIIRQKEPAAEKALPPPPPIDIKGRIVNETGEGVAASITVKGTAAGVTSTVDGYFEIKNVDNNATLVITGVNIETIEIKVNGRTDITILTKKKIAAQEEVVINAGYYTVKDRDRTGDISKVDASIIEKQPVLNPLQALQGRVPGLQVTQETGVPGGSYSVEIRGRNSIQSGSEPLYIVDGVPYTSLRMGSTFSSAITGMGNPLNGINPADIESIEILKDADATAIYGSRGANGVILINTKKGKSGKTNYDFSFYTGFGKIASKWDLLNTQQYLALRREGMHNDGDVPTIFNARDLLVWDTTRYTDWQKFFIGGTSQTTDARLSVSGGNDKTQFLVSTAYYNQSTVYPGNFAYNRFSAHLGLNHKSVDNKFTITTSVFYSDDKNKLPSTDPTDRLIRIAPNTPPLYDSIGRLNWGPANASFSNPLSLVLSTYKTASTTLVGNIMLGYEIVKGLKISTSIGYTNVQTNSISVTPLSSLNPAYYTSGESSFGNITVKTWIAEPRVEYEVKKGHNQFSALAGTSFQGSITEGDQFYASNFSSDALIENMSAAGYLRNSYDNTTQYRYNAVYARFNWNNQRKYIVNLTARRDGSSRFGPQRQWANFAAAGAAWIFSAEKAFQQALPFISYGKLRASYGTSGNDQIQDYGFINSYASNGLTYQGISALYPVRLFNPDYGWETTRKLEFGLEVGLAKDRINVIVNYYRNRSSSQLLDYPLPPVVGFSSILDNLDANVQNLGWELVLNTVNIRSANFKWTTSVNITIPRNKLLSYPGLENSAWASTYVIGRSLYITKAFQLNGVDPSTGVYQYTDANNDGIISFPADMTAIVDLQKKCYGGFQSTLSYKKLSLDFHWQFVQQTGRNFFYDLAIPGYLNRNMPTFVSPYWKKQGDIVPYQAPSSNPSTDAFLAAMNSSTSTLAYSNASFMRLKNVSLVYEPAGKWMQKQRVGNCRIFLQAENLITITNYLGLDPETQSSSRLPLMKTIAIGFQLTFN